MFLTPRVVTELRRAAMASAALPRRVRAGPMTFRNGITPYAVGMRDFRRNGNGFATSGVPAATSIRGQAVTPWCGARL
ncbi:hypothetical protein Shyhy01_70460 [Streptomyces hygroscopicus subsp. hygroscopicus]|nr:hypothetical protein Shyhy01_70460 [Streptomyces hygroscopicus subsp. hygroscopicus]